VGKLDTISKLVKWAVKRGEIPQASKIKAVVEAAMQDLHPGLAKAGADKTTFIKNAYQRVLKNLGIVAKDPSKEIAILNDIDDHLGSFGSVIGGAAPSARFAAGREVLGKIGRESWKAVEKAPDAANLRKWVGAQFSPEVLATLDKPSAQRIRDILRDGSKEGERFFGEFGRVMQGLQGAMPRSQMRTFALGAFGHQVGYDVGLSNLNTWKASPAIKTMMKQLGGPQSAELGGAYAEKGVQKPGVLGRAREKMNAATGRPWGELGKGTKTALGAGGLLFGSDLYGASQSLAQSQSDLPQLQAELLQEQTTNQMPTVADLLMGQNIQEALLHRSQRMGTATPQGAYVPAPQPARGVIKIGGQPQAAAGGQQDIASLLLGGMGSETGGGY
jgi:hypothetical protein